MTTAATDTRKNAVDHDTKTDTSNMLTMFSWGRKKRVRSVGGSAMQGPRQAHCRIDMNPIYGYGASAVLNCECK